MNAVMPETYSGTQQDLSATLVDLARANRRLDMMRLLVDRLAHAPGVSASAGAMASDRGRGPSVLWRDRTGRIEAGDQAPDPALLEALDSGRWIESPGAEGVQVAAPIRVEASTLGSLGFRGDLTEQSRSSLEDTVALAVLTLENTGLQRNAARSLTEVATVLSALIESRDAYTESHCVALAEYSVGVAIRLGLESDRLTVLNLAGHMHDIGKVSVPDAVLLKPGPLTDDEFAVMQSHASIGEEVLTRIRAFSEVAPVVGQHHERFDGDGYPRGLKGEDIILEARILAVADAFDAMTSSRPYRRALSEDVALEEISTGGGTQFDPEIAQVFLHYLEGEQAQWNHKS